jgi:hypothetical protein
MIRRIRFFFKLNHWYEIFCSGLVLVILGIASWQSTPRLAGVLAGVGGSILATVIVTLFSPAGESVYQSFLRLGVTRFWPDRSLVESDQWVKWLKEAQMRCILLGHAHGEWIRDDGFAPVLVERLTAGKTVEIFFLDPTGDGAALRQKEDSLGVRDTQGRIRGSIKTLWEIAARLNAEARARLTIYVYDSTPSLGVTWIDNWMLVTHYLAGSTNRTSPALRVEAQPDSTCPYAVYEHNVNYIRTKSTLITQDNIDKYTNE